MSVNVNSERGRTCLLCLREAEEPLLLWPCAHTFCQKCLQTWEPSHSQLLPNESTCILCPQCNQLALQQNSADKLPGNRSLNNPCHSAYGHYPLLCRDEVQCRLREARCHLEQRQAAVFESMRIIRHRARDLQREKREKKEEVRHLMHCIHDEINKRRHYLEEQIDVVHEQALCYCCQRSDQLSEYMTLLANFSEGLADFMNRSFTNSDTVCEQEFSEFLYGVEQICLTVLTRPNEPIPVDTPRAFRLPSVNIAHLVDALVFDCKFHGLPQGHCAPCRCPDCQPGAFCPGGHCTGGCCPGGYCGGGCCTGTCHPGGCYANGCYAYSCYPGPVPPCYPRLKVLCCEEGKDSQQVTVIPGEKRTIGGPGDQGKAKVIFEGIGKDAQTLPAKSASKSADGNTSSMDQRLCGSCPTLACRPTCSESIGTVASRSFPFGPGQSETSNFDMSSMGVGSIGAMGVFNVKGTEAETNIREMGSQCPLQGQGSQQHPLVTWEKPTVTWRRPSSPCPLHCALQPQPPGYGGPAPTYSLAPHGGNSVFTPNAGRMKNANCNLQSKSGLQPPRRHASRTARPKGRRATASSAEKTLVRAGPFAQMRLNVGQWPPLPRTKWTFDKNRSCRSLSETTVCSSRLGTWSIAELLQELGAKQCDKDRTAERVGEKTAASPDSDEEIPSSSGERHPLFPPPRRSTGQDHSLTRPKSTSSIPVHPALPSAVLSRALTSLTSSLLEETKLRRQKLFPPLKARDSTLSSRRRVTRDNARTRSAEIKADAVDGVSSMMKTSKRRRKRTVDRQEWSNKDTPTSTAASSAQDLSEKRNGRKSSQSSTDRMPAAGKGLGASSLEESIVGTGKEWRAPLSVSYKVVITDTAPLLSLQWNACNHASYYKVSMRDMAVVSVGDDRRDGGLPSALFLVELFTTATAVTLVHGEFDHAYALAVTALDSDSVPLARSLPEVVQTPRKVHFEHLRFDPRSCHPDVRLDSVSGAIAHRESPFSLTRERRIPGALCRLLGSVSCTPFPARAPGVEAVYWECEIHLRLVQLSKGSQGICNVGLCQATAVDREKNLATNRRSLCGTLVQDCFRIVLQFWDGWRKILSQGLATPQIMDISNQREASFRLGFLLSLPKRALVLVDVGSNALLHRFQLPKKRVEWIPAVSLHNQERVSASICYLQPRLLPDCFLDFIT